MQSSPSLYAFQLSQAPILCSPSMPVFPRALSNFYSLSLTYDKPCLYIFALAINTYPLASLSRVLPCSYYGQVRQPIELQSVSQSVSQSVHKSRTWLVRNLFIVELRIYTIFWLSDHILGQCFPLWSQCFASSLA
jgi:hypothetical protein